MKSEIEIKDKLSELYEKRLKLRLKKYLSRHYKNCMHHRLMIAGSDGKKTACICDSHYQVGRIVECNDDVCLKCNRYANLNTRESVMKEFIGDISSPQKCGHSEPKMAVLMWVLQETSNFPQENKETLCEKIKRILWLKKN